MGEFDKKYITGTIFRRKDQAKNYIEVYSIHKKLHFGLKLDPKFHPYLWLDQS